MEEFEVMMSSMDKHTYAGQYATKRMFAKKMDSSSKQRLRLLHTQLGTLLTQRKALNSKVTSRHFEVLRDAVEAGAEPYEIKQRLTRLEHSLKSEGLFKNVKGEFVHLRKDIIGSLYVTDNPLPEKRDYETKASLPGILGPKDKTFYVPPKTQVDNDHAGASGAAGQKHGHGTVSTDDMRMLNSAIGKLFRHLQINGKDSETAKPSSEYTLKDDSTQKENVNILTVSHLQPEETFHDIVLKIRNFEKEFQRHKVQQHREVMRLHEEVKRLNKNSNELRKENERMKGTQPIVTKAKGKQVERIEERYKIERRGMEEKINELEFGMRRQLLNDKEGIRGQLRGDVEHLMSSINNIHYMVLGRNHDHRTYTNIRAADDSDILPTKELLNMLTSVAGGVQVLKSKQHESNSKEEEIAAWQKAMRDLDRELTRFCRAFEDDHTDKLRETTLMIQENDPQNLAYNCKMKLQKAKENINTQLKGVKDASSVIKRKERDVIKYKKNTEELQSEICRLHDQVISVQMQDISISMPTFEKRHDNSDKSDGSADELPEADRHKQIDLLEKLRQIGTMVTHFQQLIIDRTGILNKMENDMLPLKIRVNRLHEEVSKAMTSGQSPDHDPADDIVKTKRGFSPEGPSNVFSKEISNMLTKLSKMELTIRHLLEQHAATAGRASI